MGPLDIPYYLELQVRMLDILKYVACHRDNFDVYSIKIENLFVDNCAFFDSVAQSLIKFLHERKYQFKDHSSSLVDKINGSKDFNFGDYRKHLIYEFNLNERKINLNRYEDNFIPNSLNVAGGQINNYLFAPFMLESDGVKVKWWKSYTRLKHNRLDSMKEATLEKAILSLGANYILITMRRGRELEKGTIPPDFFKLFYPNHLSKSGRMMPGIPFFKNFLYNFRFEK